MKGQCSECDDKNVELLRDPRVPPIDLEPCLCDGCFVAAVDDRIAETVDELRELKQERAEAYVRSLSDEKLEAVHSFYCGRSHVGEDEMRVCVAEHELKLDG